MFIVEVEVCSGVELDCIILAAVSYILSLLCIFMELPLSVFTLGGHYVAHKLSKIYL